MRAVTRTALLAGCERVASHVPTVWAQWAADDWPRLAREHDLQAITGRVQLPGGDVVVGIYHRGADRLYVERTPA